MNHLKKQEAQLAKLLDQAVECEDEVFAAPPEEFNKIIEEMNRRNIIPRIRKEIKKTNEQPKDSLEK